MKFTTGIIVVIVAIVIFYLRIAFLRGRKKRYEREFALKRRKVRGRSKGAALPTPEPGSSPYKVTSWFLVAASIALMLIGTIAYNNFMVVGIELIKDPATINALSEYWYIPVAAGVILLGFCVTIEKPRLNE